MIIKKQLVFLSIFGCLFFMFGVLLQGEVTLKKVYEIPLKIGATAVFPIGDEEVYVWGDKLSMIRLYKGKQLKESFPITKGEGPGDINNIGNIIKKNDRLYIWDKRVRRLSVFTLQFELLNSIKLPKLGLLANLLDVKEKMYLFEWMQNSGDKRGNIFTRKIGLVDQKGTMKCIKELSGMFSIMEKGKRRHNLDKGILIGTTDGNCIYYADNREYKIYSIDLQNPLQKPRLFIFRSYDQIKCSSEYTDLQYHLWNKPPTNEDWYEIYPKFLPPLYLIAADGASDYFLVVRNTKSLIKEEKSQIDIFSKTGEYLKTFKTPISENQWVVFSPEFYFKDSVILKNNLIYIQLEERIEVYRILE